MRNENLLASVTPPPTHLPENEEAAQLLRDGTDAKEVAAKFPAYCAAWADLAEWALSEADDPVTAYAYARTGYHRGLDQLRRAGWRGHGPVPWEHEPNRGFLRALHALGASASAIGEDDEVMRVAEFLHDSSPTAAAALPPLT